MKTNLLKSIIVAAFCTAMLNQTATAQLVLSGTSYFQNFNDIGSAGLPDGWQVRTNATSTSLGNLVTFNSSQVLWGSTVGQFANYASATNNDGVPFVGNEDAATQNACTNRAPGVRQTAAFGDPGAAFVLRIQDTLGLANFQFSADFMILSNAPRTTTWTIDYAVGNNPSSFTAVGTFPDPGAFGATNLTFSFGNALDNQSENVWIRIVALSASVGSGSRDIFAIDNFLLTWTGGSTTTNPVSIVSQPQSRTNNAGTTATFTVGATGTAPIYYQWRKGDSNLQNGDRISGATSATLQITSVTKADEGSYTCVVSNEKPSIEVSQPATLTVYDPVITTQPTSRTNLTGQSTVFQTFAAGTPPLTYQWYKNNSPLSDGGNISGSTTNFLTITNLTVADSGDYFLVVANSYGSVTSVTATLVVKAASSTRLALWDFNDTNAPATSPPPTVGSGTAFSVGGPTNYYASGSPNDVGVGTNAAWNTTPYPPQGTSNKQAGVQFNVSTVGYKNIQLSWEQRHSNTASKYHRLQYTTNGTDFIDADVIIMTVTNNTFVPYFSDLSGVPTVNNNPNFGFRIVAEWESTATGQGSDQYVGTVTPYSTGGTVRFDLVNILGDPISAAPTPIPLKIERIGGNTVLSWTNPVFSLATSTNVLGPITDKVAGATSPYTNTLPGNVRFFRLIWP